MSAEINHSSAVEEPMDPKLLALIKSQEQRRILMGSTPPKQLLWMLSWPSIIAYAANAIYTIVDDIMIAQHNPLQASAVSYSIPIAIYSMNALALMVC